MFYKSGDFILDAYYIVNDPNDPLAVNKITYSGMR